MRILLFDTSVLSTNLGDLIIMDAVRKELSELFPYAHFINTVTHEVIGRATYSIMKKSDYSFVCGTNLLSSNMNAYNQWKINLIDSVFLRDVVLLGVGWWQYQKNSNCYTRILLRRILHRSLLHAVRDNYSLHKLRYAGVQNAINTGCPTMWRLTEDHCRSIPNSRSTSSVFTLTDYKPDIGRDSYFVDYLMRNYERVYFWPQGVRDFVYLKDLKLNVSRIKLLPSSLKAFDELLTKNDDIEYIGTRLHAGTRALQHKKRSIILSVDNRAHEIGRDTDLIVLPRTEVENLPSLVESNFATRVRLNEENILIWKKQFAGGLPEGL